MDSDNATRTTCRSVGSKPRRLIAFEICLGQETKSRNSTARLLDLGLLLLKECRAFLAANLKCTGPATSVAFNSCTWALSLAERNWRSVFSGSTILALSKPRLRRY